MNLNLVVENHIMMFCVHIVVDTTFGKIINMLPGKRCVHHLNPIRSMIISYVVVEIDIRVIVQMPPPLIMLTKILYIIMSLIGFMMW